MTRVAVDSETGRLREQWDQRNVDTNEKGVPT
jgi:hypothetical protein